MGRNLVEIKCPVCSNFFNLEEKVAHSRYCNKCETLYTPYINELIYNVDYKDKYVKHENSPNNKPIQESRWNLIKKYVKSGTLLDVGCGIGAFLKEAPKEFSCFGCDINRHCIKYCKRNQNINTFSNIPKSCERFEVITMFDVLEHYPDLKVIDNVKYALKPNGYFIFCTPNFKPEMLENIEEWRHYRPKGEHVFCFSEKSIRTLTKVYGMELIEINFDESKIRLPEDNIATYVLKKDEISLLTSSFQDETDCQF